MALVEPKELQDFLNGLVQQLPPTLGYRIDEPDTEECSWFVDVVGIDPCKVFTTISYHKDSGFQLFWTSCDDSYGTKPDYVTVDYRKANDQVLQNVCTNLQK